MNKHTSGPWTVYDDFYIQVDRPGYIGGSHAEVKSCDAVGPQNKDEHKANACLISAAPDLLAALQFYISVCGNTAAHVSRETALEMYEVGQAAITKATTG